MADRFDQLTRRQRDCLKLVAELKGSKEIATELGLTKSTVDSYIAEAVQVLGARDRRDAARQLTEWTREQSPDRIGPDSSRVPRSTAEPLISMVVERQRPHWPLPFRIEGERRNDLGLFWRIAWIPLIAIGLAIGFGMLAVGLHVLSDMLGKLPLLSH